MCVREVNSIFAEAIGKWGNGEKSIEKGVYCESLGLFACLCRSKFINS